MIIYGYKHFVDEAALAAQPVAELTRLYKLVHALVDYRETQNDKIPALDRQIAEARAALRETRSTSPRPTDPKELKKAAKRLEQAKLDLAELEAEFVRACNRSSPSTETDPELGPLLAAACRYRSRSARGNGPAAQRRSHECRAVATISAALLAGNRGHLPAARRDVRPHARREFLSRSAARRREGPRRQRPRTRKRRRDLRVSRGPAERR